MGRDKDMNAHVQKCRSASANLRRVAREHVCAKKMKNGSEVRTTATIGTLTGPCDALQSSAVAGSSKRKHMQSSVEEYGVFCKRFKHDLDEHSRLIAELVPVANVPFNVLASSEFRRLHDFYVCGCTAKAGLVLHPIKIQEKMLPFRSNEEVKRASTRMVTSGMASGQYTVADDGWSSRRKIHYSTVAVGRPRVPAQIVAL
jgi:hypothetical protein